MSRPRLQRGNESIELPYKWQARPHQIPLWNAMVNRGVKRACCVWHRRAGKDSAAINIMSVKAHQDIGLYYYMAPEQKHVRKIIWDNIGSNGMRIIDQAIPKVLRENTNDQEMRIVMKCGSIFQAIGSDNYDSAVGSNPKGFVFSEWSLADPKSWTYLSPILVENGGWSIFIYTPRGPNHGLSMFRQAEANPNWFCERLTVEDTGIVTPQQIQDERDEGKSEILIQQEYYCSFHQNTETQVFDHGLVTECMQRPVPPDNPYAPHVMGVDVARFGGDRSVIAHRIGVDAKGLPPEVFQGLDNVQLAHRVALSANKYGVDAIFVDEGGIGGGVVDILKRRGLPVRGIQFGSQAAEKKQFRDKRTEMYYRFKDWTEHPESVLHDSKSLAEELGWIEYTYDIHNRLALEPKHKLREKHDGHSPDMADAYALTFAEPVTARRQVVSASRPQYAVMD